MGSTGAPWNIPYVEPTDNPRVYPAADEAQALAIAAGLSAAEPKVYQVSTTLDFTTSSTSAVDLTGVALTVTPRSATNRFLLMFTAGQQTNSTSNSNFFQFRRDTTDIFEEVEQRSQGAANRPLPFAMMFDEAAGDTTARTYSIRCRVNGSTLTVYNSSFVVIEYAP